MGHENKAMKKKRRFKTKIIALGGRGAMHVRQIFALLLALSLVAKGQGYQPDLLGRHHKVKHGRHGAPTVNKRNSEPLKTIHLAGIFPINGVEGWQGGQVGQLIHECLVLAQFGIRLVLCVRGS